MQPLRIAIDPELKKKFGPEICWTWRLLLSGIGYPWQEVPLGRGPCDIAYVREYPQARFSRLCILAEPQWWEHHSRSPLRLQALCTCGEWHHPVYEKDDHGAHPGLAIAGQAVCPRDVVFDVFWLATGQEEHHWPRNRHGHFTIEGTAFHHEKVLASAPASAIAAGLEKCFRRLGFPAPVPRWPHGKSAAASVSHDVDYPQIVRWLEPFRLMRRQGLRGLPAALSIVTGQRHHWHFGSWVALEQILHTRSAFYFSGRSGSLWQYARGTPDPFYDVRSERFRTLFKYLTDEGFEIGLHASYRTFESPEQLAAEKQTLEEASNQQVLGNRHHYCHLDPVDPEATLLLHDQVGLLYDTSLMHDRYVGWRRGLSWPFFPFHPARRREVKTLQIPTLWMDDQLFRYRHHNPGDRLQVLQTLGQRAAEQGGCVLVDVHDYVFDDALYPEWKETYRQFWTDLASRGDFWIDTPGRIAAHWRHRHALLTQSSVGLRAD
jgi:hypothetical protein